MTVQLHTTDLHLVASRDDIVADLTDVAWDKLVDEGRSLAAATNGHQWRIGDLALKVAEMRPHGGAPADVEATLNRFSNETEIPFNSLRAYRRVAAEWPEDRRLSSASWSVHQIFAVLDERFELIRSKRWTVRSAAEYVAGAPSPDPWTDIDTDDLIGHREECPLCGADRKFWARLLRRRNRA